MSLDKQLPIDFRRLFEIDVHHLLHQIRRQDGVTNLILQRLALRSRAARKNGKPGHVAGKPDARRNDDFAHRPASAKPLAGMMG